MDKRKMTSRMKGLRSLLRGLALACAALVGGAAVAAPAAPSYELNFWALMPGGSASGAGMHEAGKPVTLKATPEKGYVFAGWYEVWHDTKYRLEGDVDFRTPTYSYMMPASNIVIHADFVSVTNDVAEISSMRGATVVSEAVCTPNIEIEPIVLDVVNCKSLPKVTVKGLPPGLKFTAKALDVKVDEETTKHYKANTVYGAPTKSGVYEMTATVTTATKKTATTTVKFVVADSAKGDRILRIAYDKESGKVSGEGVYAEGKKVTLKATPAKGYIFAGWHRMDGAPLVGEGGVDYRTQSLQYVMEGDDIEFFAEFLPDYRDDARLAVRIDGAEATELVCKPKVAIDKVVLLDVSNCVTLPTVKVTGLPPGLKFTAKKLTDRNGDNLADANTIYGTPTKCGVYTTTATVTTAGKKRTATTTVTFVVFDSETGEHVLRVASDATQGKVTGAGVYAADKKVTLKATPAKGYVFTGWYKANGTTRLNGEGDVDWRTPSIAYVMPDEDAQVVARFRSAADFLSSQIDLDVGGVTVTEEVTERTTFPTDGSALEKTLWVSSESLPKVTVTGLPPGLKFTAKALDVKATKTTPAAHYKANTIYGTATKPGTHVVTVKITNATVKKAVERRFAIAVDNRTGANELLRVTDAASGEPASLKNGRGQQYTVYMGVEKHELPAITVNDSADKLTLAGLPAGLKFTAKELRNRDGSVLAKANTIYGVPTKAGFYTVTATVKSGKSSYVSTFTMEVVAMPDWAVGTFVGRGICEFGDYAPLTNNIHWTFTVAANGKVSGKVVFDTGEDRLLTATFSKPSFAAYNKGTECYSCDVRILLKDGRDVVVDQVRRLGIAPNGVEGLYEKRIGCSWMDRVDEETGESYWDGSIINAFQNAWKRKGFEDLPQFAEKKTTVSVTDAALPPDPSEPEVDPGTADLTLDIAQNGTVTATLALKNGGKAKKLVTKGDLIVLTADYDEYGTLVYSAYVSLVFGNLGLLYADVEMEALKDGVILADCCRIVSVDRFAAEEAEEKPEDGK